MADELEVKTLACFSRVHLFSRCLIHATLTRKEKEIVFLTKGDRFLYVIENGRHTNSYLFPSVVIYFEVSGQTITAITNDGRVWRTAVAKHKSKKNKQCINQDAGSSSSHAIFTELLSTESKNYNQVYNTESSVDLTEILPSQAILFEPRIQAIFTLEDSLISFGANNSGCVISCYASTNPHENNVVSCNQAAFKIFLNAPASKDKLWPTPLLCCREKTENDLSSNIIERKLFNLLVRTGKTDELKIVAITCFLLIGTPDGQVLTHDFDQAGSEMIKKSSFKLLYHLEQSVVGLHLVQLPQLHPSSKSTMNECRSVDENNPIHNVVVIIGSKGKCVLVYQIDETCHLSKHNIAGPIHCSSVKSSKDSTCIIYSNGREVCISNLSINKSKRHEKDDLSIVMSNTYICIPDICCVYSLSPKVSDDSTACIKAIAMTTKGKLLEISLPGPERKFSATLFSKQPGLQLKELLVNIENVALRTNVLDQDLESIDKVLEQLNYAATLMTERTRTLPHTGSSAMDNSQSNQYISWNVMPMLASEGNFLTNRLLYSLKFEVINQSSISLSSQWSVLISIQNKSCVLSYAVALDSLAPQSSREFVITLPDSVDLRHCIVVRTFLCCDFSLLPSILPSQVQPDLNVNNSSLVISLGENEVDILSFAKLSVDFFSHDTCKLSLANQGLYLEHLKSSCRDDKSICLKQCTVDDELCALVVPVSKNFLCSIASIGSKDRSVEEKLLNLLLGDLNDNCNHTKDAKTSPQTNKANCCNLTVTVTTGTSAEGPHDGINIVLKASTKIGLLMLLEAVIARLKFLSKTNECAVRADDLQSILKAAQLRMRRHMNMDTTQTMSLILKKMTCGLKWEKITPKKLKYKYGQFNI